MSGTTTASWSFCAASRSRSTAAKTPLLGASPAAKTLTHVARKKVIAMGWLPISDDRGGAGRTKRTGLGWGAVGGV